jgi:predicted ATPase/DNA-binding SARP family transcriptional activator
MSGSRQYEEAGEAGGPRAVKPAPGEVFALEICLFGTIEVRVDGQPLPRLRSRKGLWLLALLTLRAGRDVDRDWLCGLLWPDDREEAARRSLRQSLHDLRLALGSQAHRLKGESPRALRLEFGSDAWADVLAFDARADGRQLEDLETAVRLYRAPLLEDCAEDWAIEERRRRERQYVTALEILAATVTQYGGHTDAAEYLRRAVAVDPLREDLRRALMRALAADGSVSAALLAFREFRARLWREAAAEPDAETTALYQYLRREARSKARADALPASAPEPTAGPPRDALPTPRTALIGRERDEEEVVALLMQSRLVTLTGTGGVGKTRLALRVAEVMADEFEGGVAFVSLAALADPAGVPETVRQAIGVPNPPDAARRPLIEVLSDHLRPRRLLLTLDNCEHVLDACATLADALLSACPGVRILATSRQTLGIRGESVYRVPSLALPPLSVTEADYADYAAARLFADRARDADFGFRVTSGNAPTLARVCRRLDGIPLALELAAARVRVLSVEEIDSRLGDQFRLLTGGDRSALPRQRTLRGALDWSWNLLRASEQAFLARLSVFAGGCTLAAAEAVGDAPDVLDLLTALIDKSLVTADRGDGEGATRYRLLETVRQYAGERLDERGSAEREAARARHQAFFGKWVADLLPTGELNDGATIRLMERELDNLRAALDWRGESEAERRKAAPRALALAASMGTFWRATARPREGAERLREVLAFAEATLEGDESEAYRVAWARATGERAALARELGDYPEARALFEQALIAYQQSGNRERVAFTYREMGMLAWLQSDFPRAESLLAEALGVYRALDDRRNIARSFTALGIIAGERGNLTDAASYFGQALPVLREIGEPRPVAVTLSNFSIVMQQRGDFAAAREMAEESLAILREMGDQHSVAVLLLNLGIRAGDGGDYQAARQKIEEALRLFREIGIKVGEASALRGLASADREQGNYARARVLYRESLTLYRDLGDTLSALSTLQGVATLEAKQNRFAEAMRLISAVDALRESLGAEAVGVEHSTRDQIIEMARAGLGESAAEAARAEGRAMDFEAAYRRAIR